jgi:hypothetical protein
MVAWSIMVKVHDLKYRFFWLSWSLQRSSVGDLLFLTDFLLMSDFLSCFVFQRFRKSPYILLPSFEFERKGGGKRERAGSIILEILALGWSKFGRGYFYGRVLNSDGRVPKTECGTPAIGDRPLWETTIQLLRHSLPFL